jgi:hypothetical protein
MTKIFNQITLGEFLKQLQSYPKDKPVAFCEHIYPRDFYSYRGFYEDISMGFSGYKITVSELITSIEGDVLGESFLGYKGGKYEASKETALWAAEYGELGATVVGTLEKQEYVKILLDSYE